MHVDHVSDRPELMDRRQGAPPFPPEFEREQEQHRDAEEDEGTEAGLQELHQIHHLPQIRPDLEGSGHGDHEGGGAEEQDRDRDS